MSDSNYISSNSDGSLERLPGLDGPLIFSEVDRQLAQLALKGERKPSLVFVRRLIDLATQVPPSSQSRYFLTKLGILPTMGRDDYDTKVAEAWKVSESGFPELAQDLVAPYMITLCI